MPKKHSFLLRETLKMMECNAIFNDLEKYIKKQVLFYRGQIFLLK